MKPSLLSLSLFDLDSFEKMCLKPLVSMENVEGFVGLSAAAPVVVLADGLSRVAEAEEVRPEFELLALALAKRAGLFGEESKTNGGGGGGGCELALLS